MLPLIVLFALSGCDPDAGRGDVPLPDSGGGGSETSTPGGQLVEGGVVACTDPATGFALTAGELGPDWADEDWADNRDAQSGMEPSQTGASIAAADLDGDGRIDLVVSNAGQDRLYLGQADGTWADQTGTGRFPAPEDERSTSVSAVDVDVDGDLDLFVCTVGAPTNRLYLNDGTGWFTDATVGSGIDQQDRDCYGAGFGDLDGDGDLDLALANNVHCYGPNDEPLDCPDELERPSALLLWENQGDGTFRDITGEQLDFARAIGSLGHTATWIDIDGDLDQDLFLGNDFRSDISFVQPNLLFRNDGGQLTDISEASGMDLEFASMGTGVADLNEDGLPDFAVSGIADLVILESHGDGWIETSASHGVFALKEEPSCRVEGWGTELVDMDNDGLEDLVMVFGAIWAHDPPEISAQCSMLYLNGGDGPWQDVSEAAGLTEKGVHRGLVAHDLDGDGFVDLLFRDLHGPTRYLRSGCSDAAWLEVQLQDALPSAFGIGSRVTATVGDRTWTRWITAAGTSYQTTLPPGTAHFGFGDVDRIDELVVYWPDGRVQRHRDVATRQRVTLIGP